MPADEDDNVDTVSMSSEDAPSARKARKTASAAIRSFAQPNVENKIKVAVAQFEKRMADLELNMAELKDTIDKFRDMDSSVVSGLSELPDLKQRLEDLEDIVMVENAGIEELKNLMESLNERIQGQAPVTPQPGETEITPQVAPEQMEFLDELRTKIGELDDLKQHLDDLSHEVSSMKEMVTMGPGASMQAGNTQVFSAKLDNLKAVVDELIKRKVEIDLKIERLDKNLGMFISRGGESLPETLKKEIDTLNRNFSVIDSRMDAIESVSKNISEELQKVRSSAQKFDTFEKASNLIKDLQSKMEEFKFIENEVRRVSNRVEGFYENIDQRLDKMREFERMFPQMNQNFQQLREEVMKKLDEDKISILDRAKKDETSELRDRMSQVEGKLSDTKLKEMEKEFEKMRKELKDAVLQSNEPLSVVNIEISDIMSRLIALETRLGNLERYMQSSGRVQPIVLE